MVDNSQNDQTDMNGGKDRSDSQAGRQEQQREGSIAQQQNKQGTRQRDDDAEPQSHPGLEESNRIDLDEKGRRDQQA